MFVFVASEAFVSRVLPIVAGIDVVVGDIVVVVLFDAHFDVDATMRCVAVGFFCCRVAAVVVIVADVADTAVLRNCCWCCWCCC